MLALARTDVDRPALAWLTAEGIKWSLPLGLSLLIALFYVAAFVARHSPLQTTACVFLGLSLLIGLLEAASVPAAIPALVFDEVAYVTLGALAVEFGIRTAGVTAVQAAVFVGLFAALSGRLSLLRPHVRPAALCCGSFVGMTASNVLPGIWRVTLAALVAGLLYSFAGQCFGGIGGKLGTIAFAGTAIAVGLTRSQGFTHNSPVAVSISPALEPAALAVATLSVALTYWLSERGRFGPVLASVPSAVLALGANMLDTSWHSTGIALATLWFGASFAGMTSAERLAGRYWMLPMIGLIYGFLALRSGPRLCGFGGGLGTTALVSVLAASGVVRLLGSRLRLLRNKLKKPRYNSPPCSPFYRCEQHLMTQQTFDSRLSLITREDLTRSVSAFEANPLGEHRVAQAPRDGHDEPIIYVIDGVEWYSRGF